MIKFNNSVIYIMDNDKVKLSIDVYASVLMLALPMGIFGIYYLDGVAIKIMGIFMAISSAILLNSKPRMGGHENGKLN